MSKIIIITVSTLLIVASLLTGVQSGDVNKICSASTSTNETTQQFKCKDLILASFAARIDLGLGKHIPLSNGFVNNQLSICDQPANAKLVIDYDCSQLEMSIIEKDNRIFVNQVAGFYFMNHSNPFVLFNETNPLFNISSDSYYKCSSPQTISAKDGSVNVTLSNVTLEAFRDPSKPSFYKRVAKCELDDQAYSDWVLISVGICLIALVAIVLVAYFIGRRRWSERSSYESV